LKANTVLKTHYKPDQASNGLVAGNTVKVYVPRHQVVLEVLNAELL